MKHARVDYDRIQDPAGLIPADEPVFLLRGQDKAAPYTIRKWAKEATKLGADRGLINAALAQANAMEEWQLRQSAKVPDMPEVDWSDTSAVIVALSRGQTPAGMRIAEDGALVVPNGIGVSRPRGSAAVMAHFDTIRTEGGTILKSKGGRP